MPTEKTVRIDDLHDNNLKSALNGNYEIREKVRSHCEKWFNGILPLPEYFTKARTVFISKDGTQFPSPGEVRIISMLTAIAKLWESIVHILLFREIYRKAPLHFQQRGFIPGGSCIKNLDDIIRIIEHAQQTMQK